MKTIIKFTVAAALLLTAPFSAFAEEFTKGTVKKVDAAAKKVTIIHEELEFAGFPPFLKDAAIFAGKVSSGDDLVKHEPINAMKAVGNRSVFITQSLEDVRINIHHGQSMCDAAQSSVNEDGFVDCWFASSAIAHNDGDREGVLSHITLMLTQPDMYRDRLVGFFEDSIGTPDAVV